MFHDCFSIYDDRTDDRQIQMWQLRKCKSVLEKGRKEEVCKIETQSRDRDSKNEENCRKIKRDDGE